MFIIHSSIILSPVKRKVYMYKTLYYNRSKYSLAIGKKPSSSLFHYIQSGETGVEMVKSDWRIRSHSISVVVFIMSVQRMNRKIMQVGEILMLTYYIVNKGQMFRNIPNIANSSLILFQHERILEKKGRVHCCFFSWTLYEQMQNTL